MNIVKVFVLLGVFAALLVAALFFLQPLHHRLAVEAAIEFSDEIFRTRAPELRQPAATRDDPKNYDFDVTTRSWAAVGFTRVDGSNVIVHLRSRWGVSMFRVAFSRSDFEFFAVLYASRAGEYKTVWIAREEQ